MKNDKSQEGELNSSQLIEIIKETNPKLAASLREQWIKKEIKDDGIQAAYVSYFKTIQYREELKQQRESYSFESMLGDIAQYDKKYAEFLQGGHFYRKDKLGRRLMYEQYVEDGGSGYGNCDQDLTSKKHHHVIYNAYKTFMHGIEHRKLIQDGNDPRYTKKNEKRDIKEDEYARVHLWHYPDNQVKVSFTIPRHQKEKKLAEVESVSKETDQAQKEKKSRKLEEMVQEGRPGYGGVHNATEFDYKKAQKVRRRAAAIEKEYSKDNLRFITLTIPASTHNAKQTIAQYSSYVNSRFDDFVKNTAKRLDYEYPLAILKVIEMQKRKAQKVHNFYHWHIVLGCWSQELLSEIDSNLRDFWYNLLIDIEKLELKYREKTIDLFERHDGGTWHDNPDMLRIESAKIKQSVVAYLSKYLSKSNSKIYDPTGNEYNSQDNESYAPARWYTANAHVRELEEKFTMHWSSGGLVPVKTAKEMIDMVTNEYQKQDDKMRISWYKNFGNTILGCSVFVRNGKQLLADLWDYLSHFDLKDNHKSKQIFDEYASALVNIRKNIVDVIDNLIEYERYLDIDNAYQSWFKRLINPVSFSKMLRGFHYTLAKINPIKYKEVIENWETKYKPLLEPTIDDYKIYEDWLATKAQRLAQT